MRHSVLWMFLGVLLVTAGVGYTILWYAQASRIKSKVERVIASINKPQQVLTYESITVSGFPADALVSIAKPRLKGRMDLFLQSLAGPEASPRLYALPSWDEDVLLDGRVVLGVNALSDRYSLLFSGDWRQSATINGESFAIIAKSSGNSTCTLAMQRKNSLFGTLWNLEKLNRDSKALAEDFRALDCNFAATSINDAASGKPFSVSEPMRFYIARQPQGALLDGRFYVNSSTYVTSEGNAYWNAYLHLFNPHAIFTQLSDFGKQKIEVDFSYRGPGQWGPNADNESLTLALSNLEMSNNAYHFKTALHITNALANGVRDARIHFKTQGQATELLDAILHESIREWIRQMQASDMPENPDLQTAYRAMQQYNADEVYAILYPAIPRFHTLEQATGALDLSYSGNAEWTAGDYTLSEFELSASRYGISGSGTARRTRQAFFPAVNANLLCKQCFMLIDDTVAYTGRLQTAMHYFNPEQAQALTIDPNLVAGIKAFLQTLAAASAVETEAGTFHYAIVSDGGMGLNINGYPLDQLTALYRQTIAPFLAPPAEPEAIPPVVPSE